MVRGRQERIGRIVRSLATDPTIWFLASRPAPVFREMTYSSERVASARVRIEPASISPRHPRRRVEEQVAQLHQVTSTNGT
jgi:hypothetical protein